MATPLKKRKRQIQSENPVLKDNQQYLRYVGDLKRRKTEQSRGEQKFKVKE